MGAEAAVKLQPTGGLQDLLRKAAKPEEPKTKSKTPVLTVEDTTKELATEVRKAKNALDSAKTMFDEKSMKLLNTISAARAELCRREYQSAVRIPTIDNLSVTIVWTSQYNKIPGSAADAIMGAVGDKYAEYFTSKFALKVKDDLNEGDLTDLVQLLGEERFMKWFESEEIIKPTPRFVSDHVLMDPQSQEAVALAGVKQNKPSIKL